MLRQIADYDSGGYDYRTYWSGRDYELWAEDQVLRRLVPRLGAPRWLVDFGGGYGRNARHYRDRARHYVIADGSANNLRTASSELREDIAAGKAYLVRCDLNALPFVPYAFDAAIVVRVLHHLSDIDGALAQMAGTVGGRFLLDVPIKHHVLALVRSPGAVRGPAPLRTGSTEFPFWNFRLGTIRKALARNGFSSHTGASVNNLRRWDRSLPGPAVRVLTPVAKAGEIALRHLGRGWWGPSQFVVAHRVAPRSSEVEPAPPGVPALAPRMCCPGCRGRLGWGPGVATCLRCGSEYRWDGAYWDFVPH